MMNNDDAIVAHISHACQAAGLDEATAARVVESLLPELRQAFQELEQVRQERDTLAAERQDIVKAVQPEPNESLRHAVRNRLNDLVLLRAVFERSSEFGPRQ